MKKLNIIFIVSLIGLFLASCKSNNRINLCETCWEVYDAEAYDYQKKEFVDAVPAYPVNPSARKPWYYFKKKEYFFCGAPMINFYSLRENRLIMNGNINDIVEYSDTSMALITYWFNNPSLKASKTFYRKINCDTIQGKLYN